MATLKELRAKAKAYGIDGYSKMDKWTLDFVVTDFEKENPHIVANIKISSTNNAKKKAPEIVKITGSMGSEEGATVLFDDGHTEHYHYELAPGFLGSNKSEASAPATTEQQTTHEAENTEQPEPMASTREIVSTMTVKKMHEIARLVGYKGYSTRTKKSLIMTLPCKINFFMDNFYNHALEMSKNDIMKIVVVTGTDDLRWTVDDVRSILNEERITRCYDNQDSRNECISELCQLYDVINFYAQAKTRETQEAANAQTASATTAPTTTEQQTANEPETAPVEVKQETKPIQTSTPKTSTPAKPARKLPTPKNRSQIYDFSACKDAKALRKALNAESIDVVKAIAESYREFQPHTDEKTMTKKDYVTAIIRLYFPDYQSKAPDQNAKPDFHGVKFIPGKIYVLGSYYDIINNRSPRLFKVIRRNKSSIVIQEISNPDFIPAIGTECKTIKTCNRYPFSEYISFSRYSYDNLYAYWDYDTIFPYSPGYDVDFDETAYSPDVEKVSVIVDDIPADHEPDTQPIQTSKPNSKPAAHAPRKWMSIDEAKQKAAEEVNPLVNAIKTAKTKEEIIAVLQRAKNKPVIVSVFLDTVDQGSYILNYIYHKELRTKAGHLPRKEFTEYVAGRIIDLRKKSLIPSPEVSTPETNTAAKITPETQPEDVQPEPVQETKPKPQPASVEPEPARKPAPKPATRKPRHAKKTDTSRQILIPFDDEERPDPTSEPAKLKAKRRPRMPRVKTDYSRQILIDFGEDIPSSQTNQRQAA